MTKLILLIFLVGGFNPSEKYESQWEAWHPIYEMDNNPNVWNQQPEKEDMVDFTVAHIIIKNHHQSP
jgi:hypothetical protein